MSERKRKLIIGGISGAVTGIILEFLRGSSYMAGVSGTAKAVLTGIVAWLIYMAIIAIIKSGRPVGERF